MIKIKNFKMIILWTNYSNLDFDIIDIHSYNTIFELLDFEIRDF